MRGSVVLLTCVTLVATVTGCSSSSGTSSGATRTGGGSSVSVVTGRTEPLAPMTGQGTTIRDRSARLYGSVPAEPLPQVDTQAEDNDKDDGLGVQRRRSCRRARDPHCRAHPERAPLVRLGFDTFAVGNYSITAMQELLEEAGLRTLQTPKRAPGPLSRAAVHRMLRSDYYIGFVTWKRAKITGRHEPLIDAGNLPEGSRGARRHRQKGSRRRKYDHYLRGSVYCRSCGRRLIFSRVRGNGGQYEYLGCISRPGRGETYDARHLPVGDVEQAVERYHAHFRLSPDQEDAIRCEIERHAGALAEHAGKEAERHARRFQELQRQQ